MYKNQLTLEQQFQLLNKAHIEILDPVPTDQNLDDLPILNNEERMALISMPESQYNLFINAYGNYLTLCYGLTDPVAKNMFEKLMIYLTLKK